MKQPDFDKKKVLLIAYHFPPSSEVGGIRPAKFAKYLPEFGWKPYVLTIKENKIKSLDIERLNELRDLKIIRTKVYPSLLDLAVKLRSSLQFRGHKENLPDSKINHKNSNKKTKNMNSKSRVIFKTKQLLNSVLSLPDEQIGWLIPAIWRGFWVIKKEKIDKIISTGPPETAFLIGYVLSRLTDAKLILDFRDPCFSNIFKNLPTAHRFGNALEHCLGKKIIHHSYKILTVTEEYRDYLANYYKGLKGDKIFALWNGFDEDNSIGVNDEKRDNVRFVISYVGRFYGGQNPRGFFAALRELLEENFFQEDNILVKFIGIEQYVRGELTEKESLDNIVRRFDLERITSITGRVPYHTALREIGNSDVLLVFTQTKHEHFIIPSKVFEIMGLHKRILCFTTGGATYNFLEKVGGALLADQDNPIAIKAAIKKFYHQWLRGDKIKYNIDTSIFGRRALTKQLIKILN